MGKRFMMVSVLVWCYFTSTSVGNASISPQNPASPAATRYYWSAAPVGDSAQLVTLFRVGCGSMGPGADTIPLIAVLRDTLGDGSQDNDRITYVWLLSLTQQNAGQRILAGIPFFYWRVGDGSTRVREDRPVRPLMDLTKPQQPMAIQITRNVLQWTVLDPLSMPVRASSRAYRTNEVAKERAHLEEAIGYLQQAPKTESGEGLTQAEANTLIARLALRESLLGGLVSERQAQRVGERELAEHDTVRTRNWDLLRTFAEKSGLYFEPLQVSGAPGEYALLWFPADSGDAEPVNSSHAAVWKALNLRNPWTDKRLKNWEGPVFDRSLDASGALLPAGSEGARDVRLIPLGAYSLTYPKFPLLVIDFRDKLHVRRNEMTQRTINEITSGVIGISHFTNWYYYAGASTYDFVASRHGKGMDAAHRMDSYAKFRSSLALDGSLDTKLRTLLQQRIDSVSMNPLESSPEHAVQVAKSQYAALLNEVSSGTLARRLQRTRENELANFGKTQQALASQAFLHTATFGLLPPRPKENADVVPELNRIRGIQASLNLLNGAAGAGGNPEVLYDPVRLRAAVQQLSELLPEVRSEKVRTQAAATLRRLSDETKDPQLQADCLSGLRALRNSEAPGVAASPKVLEKGLHSAELPK